MAWLLPVLAFTALTGCRSPWGEKAMIRKATRHPGLVWECSAAGLDKILLKSLCQVATAYFSRTGSPLVLTSGKRHLHKQAELMAAMSREQLEGMYCQNGYPSYIRDILSAREEKEKITVEDTHLILANRTEGYISSHLYGGAIDIASDGMDVELLERLLNEHGFRSLDERNLGINCIHATHRKVPRKIIR